MIMIMDRAYQGLREDGVWEQFNWSESFDPTPENTGYVRVEEITR